VFSDAHVRPYPGWAEPLLDAARRPGVGAVAPRVHSLTAPSTVGYGFTWHDPSLRMRWLDGDTGRPRPVPFLCGCFVAVPRPLFAEIGGFDEGLVGWGSEDAELSLRLWGLGYSCEVVPAAGVAHLFRRRFPYAVEPVAVMHNTFRLATVHLGEPALARVFAHHRRRPGFAPAYARLAASDVDERRDRVRRERVADAESLFARFGIRALG